MLHWPRADAGGATVRRTLPTMAADQGTLVRFDRAGPVVTLTLDSQHNRNALSRRLLAELHGALTGVQADPEVRVVVLTGAGRAFCSGVDLTERLHPPPGDPPATLAEVLTTIVAMPQPVIARVNGHVRAGGMGLVAACDLAVADGAATFAFTEVRVGVAPAVIAVPALRRMARRAFERYALTGDVFDAAEAAASRLLTAAVPDRTGLDTWVDAAVRSVLAASPQAVAASKGLADLTSGPWADALAAAEELSDRLFASEHAAEGMGAFLEKRPPAWVVDWAGGTWPAGSEGDGRPG